MTHDELQAIKARAEAATPGSHGAAQLVRFRHAAESAEAQGHALSAALFREAAEFIAHARTDVPALIAEVERLRAENEEMRAVIAAEKDSADAYVVAFDAEVDRRATAEAEVERLREALTVMVRQRCPSCDADNIAKKMLRGEPLPDELRELYLT